MNPVIREAFVSLKRHCANAWALTEKVVLEAKHAPRGSYPKRPKKGRGKSF